MELYEHELYREDVRICGELPLDWECLRDRTVLITGASGLIGSFLIDVLMSKKLNCRIYAVGRNTENAKKRFAPYWESENFRFLACDVNEGIAAPLKGLDYIIHAASNTHPALYAQDPIGTITANVLGTYHVLELAAKEKVKRVLFLSSVEVYGENRGDCERFAEDYCGYLDCNTLRAGYPESKRAGEALCQAYIRQKGLDIVIPRLPRTYGPTMQMSDTKAIAQFIKKGAADEDIVLKSEGNQLYSYCHVLDSVSGIFWCLMKGACGEAYNIADEASDMRLKDIARLIADYVGKKVIYELPDAVEQAGYSRASVALMDSTRLRGLGWRAVYPMKEGVERTISILKGEQTCRRNRR